MRPLSLTGHASFRTCLLKARSWRSERGQCGVARGRQGRTTLTARAQPYNRGQEARSVVFLPAGFLACVQGRSPSRPFRSDNRGQVPTLGVVGDWLGANPMPAVRADNELRAAVRSAVREG